MVADLTVFTVALTQKKTSFFAYIRATNDQVYLELGINEGVRILL